jgi:hypothetical protein
MRRVASTLCTPNTTLENVCDKNSQIEDAAMMTMVTGGADSMTGSTDGAETETRMTNSMSTCTVIMQAPVSLSEGAEETGGAAVRGNCSQQTRNDQVDVSATAVRRPAETHWRNQSEPTVKTVITAGDSARGRRDLVETRVGSSSRAIAMTLATESCSLTSLPRVISRKNCCLASPVTTVGQMRLTLPLSQETLNTVATAILNSSLDRTKALAFVDQLVKTKALPSGAHLGVCRSRAGVRQFVNSSLLSTATTLARNCSTKL